MKCEIRLVCMGNVIALYRREGHGGSVLFSALSEYWQYSNEEDVEEAILQPMSDGNILGILTTAQGQGGIVFIWDTLRDIPVHLSEVSYAIAATVFDDKVFALRYIRYWGIEPHAMLSSAPLNAVDLITEPDSRPVNVGNYDGSPATLRAVHNGFMVSYGNNEFLI